MKFAAETRTCSRPTNYKLEAKNSVIQIRYVKENKFWKKLENGLTKETVKSCFVLNLSLQSAHVWGSGGTAPSMLNLCITWE
jgi:hypothetical protein